MISSKWDTATGEVVVRCDAQTAHELVKLLDREAGRVPELVKARDALRHTTLTPPAHRR